MRTMSVLKWRRNKFCHALQSSKTCTLRNFFRPLVYYDALSNLDYFNIKSQISRKSLSHTKRLSIVLLKNSPLKYNWIQLWLPVKQSHKNSFIGFWQWKLSTCAKTRTCLNRIWYFAPWFAFRQSVVSKTLWSRDYMNKSFAVVRFKHIPLHLLFNQSTYYHIWSKFH